jgi:hypothetical protein
MDERKSCADLAGDLSQEGIKVAAFTVWTLLTKAGFKKTNSTGKPRLTWKMRRERLQWRNYHEHWTLGNMSNVIWSDETSVVLPIAEEDTGSGGCQMRL